MNTQESDVLGTAQAQLANVESSPALGQDSKAYYRKQVGMFQKILGVGSSALWSPLVLLAALIRPTLSLIPIGHIGGRQWTAKGIDSCPMEGFSAPQVAKLLRLPRGSVIPLVIALVYRAEDTRIEERFTLK